MHVIEGSPEGVGRNLTQNSTEVTIQMASDDRDTIRAKIVSTLDREAFYYPRHVEIERVANLSVATSDVGKAKTLVNELARDDSTPVRYVVTDETVALEVDSQRHAAATIRRFDPDQLEWSHKQRL